MSHEIPIQVFDATQRVEIVDRRLPHWSQAGTICFMTWRTCDSMPRDVVDRWLRDRAAWLRRHDIEVNDPHWRSRLRELPAALIREFHERFDNRWNEELDRCHGSCVLRRADLSAVVEASLMKFDGSRYEMLDFVVMPNHLHLLAAFPDEASMLSQAEAWKRFTATRINRALGQSGRFWQQDGFDHLVRSVDQFEYLRRYIRDNPSRAGLQPGEFKHYSKPL